MATVTEAKIPDREIDGFVNSGHYGLKAIVLQWMRESPGRYWVAYVGFMASVILSLLFQWARGSAVPIVGTGAQELMLKIQSAILTVCLMYVAIVNNTVGELMMTYMVALCEMQIMIDTIRVSIVKPDDRRQSYFTLALFAVMSILAVVLQDSFGPLNRLNLTYFLCLWFIVYFAVPDNYFERTGTEAGKMVGGTLASAASVAHVGFCLAAFNITEEVEEVPTVVIAAFFYTTVAMFSFSHSLPDFLPELQRLRPNCHVGRNLVSGYLFWCRIIIWNNDSLLKSTIAGRLAAMLSEPLTIFAVYCMFRFRRSDLFRLRQIFWFCMLLLLACFVAMGAPFLMFLGLMAPFYAVGGGDRLEADGANV